MPCLGFSLLIVIFVVVFCPCPTRTGVGLLFPHLIFETALSIPLLLVSSCWFQLWMTLVPSLSHPFSVLLCAREVQCWWQPWAPPLMGHWLCILCLPRLQWLWYWFPGSFSGQQQQGGGAPFAAAWELSCTLGHGWPVLYRALLAWCSCASSARVSSRERVRAITPAGRCHEKILSSPSTRWTFGLWNMYLAFSTGH